MKNSNKNRVNMITPDHSKTSGIAVIKLFALFLCISSSLYKSTKMCYKTEEGRPNNLQDYFGNLVLLEVFV